MDNKTPFYVGLATCPNMDLAKKIAQGLVEGRLAACITLIPGATSIFRWQDKVQAVEEVVLVIKTRSTSFGPLARYIKENHSYQVPEIIALPILEGEQTYMTWLGANTHFGRR